MKRLNWLKNFGLTAGVACATVPAVMLSASCSQVAMFVDVFDFEQTLNDASAANVKRYATSSNNLLYGSMSNHNGNYILFVGSNTNKSVCDFFGVLGRNYLDRDQWYKEENFKNSPFYNCIYKTSLKDEYRQVGHLKSCGFYSLIDFFDRKVYDKKGHEIFISKDGETVYDTIKPFDKWNDSLIANTKNYNKNYAKYEWDSDSVSKSDYIRQDDQAKAYRDICKRGLQLYPKTDKRKDTFNTDDNSDSPKMCVFKDGKLVSIEIFPNGASVTGQDAFIKILIDNYKDVKDEEKK